MLLHTVAATILHVPKPEEFTIVAMSESEHARVAGIHARSFCGSWAGEV
jgi:hypothetical protein